MRAYPSARGLLSTATQRILAIAEDPATLERLAAAIQAGGAQPILARGLGALEPGTIPARFIVFSWDGSPEPFAQLVARLRPGVQLVAALPQSPLAILTQLLAEPACNHVVTLDDAGLACLTVTVAKFVSGDLFGIEKYLPAGTEVHLTRLRDYQGRQRAIDEILASAEKLGVRSKVRSQIGQVCEELLMNALYDAPVDETGKLLFGEVDLKARLEQLSPRPVSIRYASTDLGFAISVRDRFGRLDKATILRYLDKCLHSGNQIDRKIYGAGLGLYLVANAATQYVVNVAPGMATEVVCTFDRKGVRTGLRALSVFVHPGTQAAQG
jgi:hypothetical protein